MRGNCVNIHLWEFVNELRCEFLQNVSFTQEATRLLLQSAATTETVVPDPARASYSNDVIPHEWIYSESGQLSWQGHIICTLIVASRSDCGSTRSPGRHVSTHIWNPTTPFSDSTFLYFANSQRFLLLKMFLQFWDFLFQFSNFF